MASNKVYEIVTDQIIKKLEKGTVPWRKPWNAKISAPRNYVTGRPYTGLNVMLLVSAGYLSPYWMTFKQAKQKGGSVRKGEHGQLVVFWKKFEIEQENEDGELVKKKIPMLRYYTVFNLDQIDGLKAPESFEDDGSEPEPNLTAEEIVNGYKDKPVINENGTSAFYRPFDDVIVVPPRKTFDSMDDFYDTLFHELGHSTGHSSRLNRHNGSKQFQFGSHDYGREELVAEMTAAFLTAEAGITRVQENEAAYLQGWISKLREDVKAVAVAATAAQKAADYILGRNQE